MSEADNRPFKWDHKDGSSELTLGDEPLASVNPDKDAARVTVWQGEHYGLNGAEFDCAEKAHSVVEKWATEQFGERPFEKSSSNTVDKWLGDGGSEWTEERIEQFGEPGTDYEREAIETELEFDAEFQNTDLER
ncbi:MAG: hypothetical protein AAFS13_09765 [Pseudomonadota bacterium]